MIPISRVDFGPEEEASVLEVLRSGMIAQGPKVAEFESAFAEAFGATHAVAVNNGTTALIAAMEVLDLGPGDEVITTPFTFVATVNAVLSTGASVRFADIRTDDFNIDPASVEALVTDRTKAIVPVHLYGQMADMAPIMAIAERHGLAVVEDSAQSHGAMYDGRFAGTFGIGTFSFYATKNIATGEGGMITTSDDAVADKLRVLRNQGMRARYQYEFPGNNYRLTDLQAAVGVPQLARYEGIVEARQRNAAALTSRLEGVHGIVPPRQLEGRRHVWHQYTIRVTEDAGITRDQLSAQLVEDGVGSGVYYPALIGDYAAYQGHPQIGTEETPVAAEVVGQVLSLPVHPHVGDDGVALIADSIAARVGVNA
jgi:perosamine synthetase